MASDRALERVQRITDKHVLTFNKHMEELWKRMDLTKQRTTTRRAARYLRDAKRNMHDIKRWLDPQSVSEWPFPDEEVAHEENFAATENEADQQFSAEGVNDEQQTELTTRGIFRRWKRCLEAIAALIAEGFDKLFVEVAEFVAYVRGQQNDIQTALESRLADEAIDKTISRARRLHRRLTSSSRASTADAKLKQELDHEIATLLAIGPDNPKVTAFLHEIHDPSSEASMAAAQARARRAAERERIRENLARTFREVEETMRLLNTTVDRRLQEARREAEDTTAMFKQRQAR